MSSLSLQDLRIIYRCEGSLIVRIDLEVLSEQERAASPPAGHGRGFDDLDGTLAQASDGAPILLLAH